MLRQFDDVVATLELALDDLHASHVLLTRCRCVASTISPGDDGLAADTSASVATWSVNSPSNLEGRTAEVQDQGTAAAGGIDSSHIICWLNESRHRAAAMSTKLVEWRSVVTSHQSASRVLKWSVSQVGPAT